MHIKHNVNPELLRQRNSFFKFIRDYFFTAGYTEVHTPLIAAQPLSELSTEPIKVYPFNTNSAAYLISSPEYFMKRLLVYFPEKIFQITPAFRQGELGSQHNIEFMLLEWYHPNCSYEQAQTEAAEFILQALNLTSYYSLSYQEAFDRYLQLDPFNCDSTQIQAALTAQNLNPAELADLRAQTIPQQLDYLFTFFIQPKLGQAELCILTDYPKVAGVLATEQSANIANRFECFFRGIEICNGFEELRDYSSHKQHMNEVQTSRANLNLNPHELDTDFLTEMKPGLPQVCGVALGIERLLALKLGYDNFKETLTFSWEADYSNS